MKKSIKYYVLLLLAILFLFGGCTRPIPKQSETTIANKTFGIIMDLIKAQDESALESLFSPSVQSSSSDLKNSIKDLFQFIQGNPVSFSDASEAGVGVDDKAEKGKRKRVIQSSFTYETDVGKYYFAIKECTKDDNDKNNIGILSVYVIQSEDWQEDYIYRGDGEWLPGIRIDR